MKCIIISLVFTGMLASCNSERADPGNIGNNNPSVEEEHPSQAYIDSVNQLLDPQDTSMASLEALPDADFLDIKADVAYSKFNQYQQEVPLSRAAQQLNTMAAARQLARAQQFYSGADQNAMESEHNWTAATNEFMQDQFNLYQNTFANTEKLYLFLNDNLEREADSVINTLDNQFAIKKILLIDKLLKKAEQMFDVSNYGKNDSINNQPIRPGIKYAWGSKELAKKYNPSKATRGTSFPSTCDISITGLDCSGFIYQLFKQNEVKISPFNANTLRDTTTMRKVLTTYFGTTPFELTDIKKPSPWAMESGDIIYFYTADPATGNIRAHHIGMVLKSPNSSLKLFHCSGGQNRCEYNIGNSGGIRCPNISNYLTSRMNYGVVRITPPR